MTLNDIPIVTSLDKFDDAVEAFARSAIEFKAKLKRVGLSADDIRYLATHPGRRIVVRQRD